MDAKAVEEWANVVDEFDPRLAERRIEREVRIRVTRIADEFEHSKGAWDRKRSFKDLYAEMMAHKNVRYRRAFAAICCEQYNEGGSLRALIEYNAFRHKEHESTTLRKMRRLWRQYPQPAVGR